MKIITTKANQVIGIFTFITLVFCSYGNSAERKAYQFVIVKSAVDKAYLSCAKETEPSATLHTYKNPMYWTVYTPEFEEALVQLVASFDTMRNIKIEDCKKSLEDIRTQVIKLIGIKNENIEKKAEDAKVVLDKKNIKSAIDEKNKNYKSSDISLLQRINPNNFPLCPKPDISKKRDFGPGSWTEKWDNCWASISMVQIEYNGEFQRGIPNGLGEMILIQNEKKIRYAGDFKDGRPHGLVTILGDDKIKYEGQMKNGQINGMGALYTEDLLITGEFHDGILHGMGRVLRNGQVVQEGFYENGKLVRESKVKLPNIVNNSSVRKLIINQEIANVLTQDVKKENDKLGRSYEANLAENKFKIEVKKIASPDDGSVIFEIQTNLDTASLKINGEEEGGSTNGKYLIKKFARAGQITEFKIEAISVSGKTALHTESVDRPLPAQKHNYAKLNPSLAKKSVKRDAVAIVIGISAYKNFPKAEYANADAKEFVEYAIRVLGVTDIRLLIDEEAEIEEIYKTFKTWLPPRVKSSTDLYIFYSGHGMPSPDGKNLFWLPQRASRELISKTALSVEEIIQDIKETKPKSVTMFIDACYSGLARNGETLIKDARPVSIKSNDYTYPDNFVVFSASMADQISSSSPELQHGVFSYYLMKGMEGEADITKDGKITFGELQEYLSEKISRHASTMGRKQNPQLIGDKEKIFVLK